MQLAKKEVLFPADENTELTATRYGSQERDIINKMTADFWRDFIFECKSLKVDPEKEFVRVRHKLAQHYHAGRRYDRKRPVAQDKRKNNTFKTNKLDKPDKTC